MLVKDRYISLLFSLMLIFLSACGATAVSESDIKNEAENVEKESAHPSSETGTDDAYQNLAAVVKKAGNKSSSHRKTEDKAGELHYLDFKGDYVLYQGEPHQSEVAETLVLEEDYVEWSGIKAEVQKYDIEENHLKITAVQQVKESSSDQVSQTHAHHLHYTLDYRDPHKVLIDPDGRVYYQQPAEIEDFF